MEETNDYISIEELKQIQQPKVENNQITFIEVIGRIFKGIWVILRFLWFGLCVIGKMLWNMIVGLEDMLEKVRKSPMGKQLRQQHNSQPQFNLKLPKQNNFKFIQLKKKSKKDIFFGG